MIKFSLFILSRWKPFFFYQLYIDLKIDIVKLSRFSLSNHVISYEVFSYSPQISFQRLFVSSFVILSTAVQPLSPAVTPRYSQVLSTILTRNNILTPANLLDASSVNKPVMLLSRFIKDRGEIPTRDDQDLILRDVGRALSFIRHRVGPDVHITHDKMVVQLVGFLAQANVFLYI